MKKKRNLLLMAIGQLFCCIVQAQDVTYRDITADRGDGTGALYLSNKSNSKYLYWNGSGYKFGHTMGIEYDALHSGNFHLYSPTLNGSGASGTWGINISGNAASYGGSQMMGTASSAAPNYLFGAYAGGLSYYSDATAVRSFLGIPANGETLQSVMERNGISSKAIFLTGNESYSAPTLPSLTLSYNTGGGYGGLFAYDYSNSTAKHLILQEPGGNVGIGTNNPAYKLEVAGKVLANTGDAGFQVKRGNNHVEFFAGESGEMVFYQSTISGYPLWIQQNGNVGIGKTNPASKLDVNGPIHSYYSGFGSSNYETTPTNFANFGANNHGSILIGSNLYCSGSNDLKVANDHETMSGAAILIPGNSQPHQNGILFFTRQPGPVAKGAAYTATPAMIINAAGSVRIGNTTAPADYKLAVDGTIGARKLKVTQETWADYVFDSAYLLQPLQQLEQYILNNKHLPEIPSAATVKKEGIDLGDNQALLLKKVEELTLYIIQQNKDIQEQKKAMQIQQEKMLEIEKELEALKQKK